MCLFYQNYSKKIFSSFICCSNRLKKVTAEFNEQVKKRHRKRIVNIKQEPVIDLSADEEAETKHSEEKANGKRKSQRTLKKPSRFI